MTARERNRFYADRMKRVALRNHTRDLKLWNPVTEPEMIDLVNNDRKDHLHIVSLIRQGKIGQAWDIAQDLDTSSRDAIPDSVWRFLGGEY